jgi:hypothetical protein
MARLRRDQREDAVFLHHPQRVDRVRGLEQFDQLLRDALDR